MGLTLGTTLERYMITRLVRDNQRYMAQAHISHDENAHLNILQLPASSFHFSEVQIYERGRHGTFADRMSGT
jgi:hypothetical protein